MHASNDAFNLVPAEIVINNVDSERGSGLLSSIVDLFSLAATHEIEIHGGQVVFVTEDPSQARIIIQEIAETHERQVSYAPSLDWENPIDLTALMKEAVDNSKILFDENAQSLGVNCYNTVLLAAGLLNRPSYVGSEELNFYLDNFCTIITAGDPLPPRAIGVIYRRQRFTTHAIFVISQQVLFEKKGFDSQYKYSFQVVDELPEAEYYKCHNIEEICTDTGYLTLKKESKSVEDYFLNVFKAGAYRREVMLEKAKALLNQVEALDPTPNCQIDRQRLRFRLLSLIELAESVQGSGLNRILTGEGPFTRLIK